jgi:hypothetical protein
MSQSSKAAKYLFWHDHLEELILRFKSGSSKPFPWSLNITCDCSVPTYVLYWQLVWIIAEATLSLTRFSMCTLWQDVMTSSRCASTIDSSYWLYCRLMKKFIFWYIIFIVKLHMTFHTSIIIHESFEISRCHKDMGLYVSDNWSKIW